MRHKSRPQVVCFLRIIFFKRIDVFLQSRYACCGVRLWVRWLAPPGAHKYSRWHAPPSSKDSEGALLKPPSSRSVLRRAFVREEGPRKQDFRGKSACKLRARAVLLPDFCGTAVILIVQLCSLNGDGSGCCSFHVFVR